MLHLVPYKAGCRGINAIRDYLDEEDYDYKYIRPNNFFYNKYLYPHGGTTKKALVALWGNVPTVTSGCKTAFDNDVINKNKILNANAPEACNKRTFLKKMSTDQNLTPFVPPFTESSGTAFGWLEEGHKVVCRKKLNGHSGDGIVIASSTDQLVEAPLYVKYLKKKSEYRVHINKLNTDFSWQQKRLRNGYDANNPLVHQVRNLQNGWVYCRSEVNPPQVVIEAATILRDSPAFTLDFAAVDIIYNEAQNKAYILEANTAPGLCGGTVKWYADLFKNWAHQVSQA